MNRDDITRLAREAGFVGFDGDNGSLRRFAALVASAEREACAKFLECGVDLAGLAGAPDMQRFTGELLMGCAKAIRARGNT